MATYWLGHGVGESECMSSLGSVSQLAIALWIYREKLCWFSKLDVLKSHFSVAGLKSWSAHYGDKTFSSSKRNRILGSCLFMGHSVRSRINEKLVSQPFLPSLMWVYSSFAQWVAIAQTDLEIFSEEKFPYVAVESVCPWEEVSSESIYIIMLS